MKANKQGTNLFNYFRPNIFVRNCFDLSIFWLKKQNIKLVICDLDNTLAPHFSRYPSAEAINFCKSIKQNDIKFILASNNTKKRVSYFAEKLQPHEYIYAAKKPLLFKIKKIIKKYKFDPNEILFVGDQFLIDIWTANRIGAKSVLVLPLTDVINKKSPNKLMNFIEKYIYKKIQHNNIIIEKDDKDYDML